LACPSKGVSNYKYFIICASGYETGRQNVLWWVTGIIIRKMLSLYVYKTVSILILSTDGLHLCDEWQLRFNKIKKINTVLMIKHHHFYF
jgi:hypothetical protein